MLPALIPLPAREKIGQVLLTMVVLLMLVFFEIVGINQPIVQVGQSAINPLLQFNVRLVSGMYQFTQNVRSWQNTARRVQDLELKLAHTSAQLGKIEQLEKENQELRALLNSSDRSLDRVVLTSPILSLAQPAVGLPLESEVRPGLAVMAENTLVGVVTQVRNNVAYVGLLWQKDSPYVLAQTSAGIQGMLMGDGRRVLLTEIPVEEELEVGQRVLTSGQEGISAGLYVGEIRSIRSGASSAFKTAVIEQYVSFHESSLVEIRL